MTTLSNEALAKLLPCPFCGGDDITVDHAGRDTHYFVQCNDCDVIQDYDHGYTKAEAITAWNTRTPPVREDVLEAIVNGDLALINWQKYNAEQGDEVVYQAEKLATSLRAAIRALKTTPPEPADDPEELPLDLPAFCLKVMRTQLATFGVEPACNIDGALAVLSCHSTPTTPENSELVTQADRQADTYQIGNQLFVMLRAFLNSAGVDPSKCTLIIEMPAASERKAIVDSLQRWAPPVGEFTRVSSAQAGNYGGKWQGVAYEFAIRALTEPTTKYGRGSTGNELGDG